MTADGVTRYVVGFSGDRRSRDAVRLGAAMARDLDAELEFVLVLRTEDPHRQVHPPVGDFPAVLRSQAHQWLREAAALVPEGVADRARVCRARSVPAGLAEAATGLGAARDVDRAPGGLLLIGSSRLARGRRTFPGSTAAQLLRHLPVPVVVVPRPDPGTAQEPTDHEPIEMEASS